MKKYSQEEVLKYKEGRQSQKTVLKYYLEWRSVQNPLIPLKCDTRTCIFNKGNLEWNGNELPLILDHKNGVSGDNRPKNLQLLCPNCNSQQETHGGKNKGRVQQSVGGFGIKRKDGKIDYTLPAETAKFKLTFNQVKLNKSTKSDLS